MPTPEEIKNLCMEYAESVKSEYVSAKLIETLVMGFYHSHLKNDYCIVPKSKVKEWEGIVENALKADPVITEPAFRFMWERLFNEEKGCAI